MGIFVFYSLMIIIEVHGSCCCDCWKVCWAKHPSLFFKRLEKTKELSSSSSSKRNNDQTNMRRRDITTSSRCFHIAKLFLKLFVDRKNIYTQTGVDSRKKFWLFRLRKESCHLTTSPHFFSEIVPTFFILAFPTLCRWVTSPVYQIKITVDWASSFDDYTTPPQKRMRIVLRDVRRLWRAVIIL